jgi:uncharacterized protein (DUF2141 family)
MTILFALAVAQAATAAGSITVDVGNVRSAKGRVIVDICPQNRFLEDGCMHHGEAAARAGTTRVTVPGVPPGEWAAQAFHDENANGDIDRAMFGIPKEGVGFSRNARITFSPPKWRDAVFSHPASASSIRFDLRYFTGAKGPPRGKR